MKRIVLLVDDEEPIRKLFARRFDNDGRFAGVDYMPCATYEEVVAAYLKIARTDVERVVLVTDYNLNPPFTGDDVIKTLVTLGFTGPVVMMSGKLPDDDRTVAGLVFTVLHKPFKLATLADAVHALLTE